METRIMGEASAHPAPPTTSLQEHKLFLDWGCFWQTDLLFPFLGYCFKTVLLSEREMAWSNLPYCHDNYNFSLWRSNMRFKLRCLGILYLINSEHIKVCDVIFMSIFDSCHTFLFINELTNIFIHKFPLKKREVFLLIYIHKSNKDKCPWLQLKWTKKKLPWVFEHLFCCQFSVHLSPSLKISSSSSPPCTAEISGTQLFRHRDPPKKSYQLLKSLWLWLWLGCSAPQK